MSLIEWIAALYGVISVYLSARENIWNWPTAIVNVGLYSFIFWRTGLYFDMGLQVVYLVLSIYGWYEWLYGGTNKSELTVTRATPAVWLVAVAVLAVFLVLAHFATRLPGVSLPYLDGSLTALSLVAQWMMTRKILENWILWILVDVAYVPMYVYKKLPVTAALYAVFLILAVLGLVHWSRSLRETALRQPASA